VKIGVNGHIVDDKEAVVSVYDHGFMYGMGVFETFRTYGGRPFLFTEHLRRLAEGCRQLGIDYEPDETSLRTMLDALLTANGLRDAYVRLTVTAGSAALGLPAGAYMHPTTVMYVKELPKFDASLYERGKALQLLKLRRSSPEGPFRLKSLHYMNNILAKREMSRYPWAHEAEGLFLDARGFVAEGIVSNLFFISGGEICTPSPETGLLEGITRNWVIGALRAKDRNVREGLYTWDDLLKADEIFITNSIQEIVPVRLLFDERGQSHAVGGGAPGEWTKRLLAEYREAAAKLNF
jgi:4-amino-4-deoxychorismate lyase